MAFRTASLEATHDAVVKDAGKIPVVTVEYFQNAFLPPLSKNRADVLANEMTSKEDCLFGPAENPAQSGKTEAGAFRPMKTVFDKTISLIEQADSTAKPTLKYICKLKLTSTTGTTNASRPDSFLQLIDGDPTLPTEDHPWENIVSADEYKLQDREADATDDSKKVIWSGFHMLRNDPCRKFAFGLTIEDTSARFWYFSRFFLVTSEFFSYITTPLPLLRYYAALAFATPTELGYDPSIKRIRVDEHLQYEITHGNQRFCTKQVLSDFQAKCIRGKATRAWEVYDLENPQKRLVMKDIWLDCEAKSEHEIWETFRNQVHTLGDEDDLKILHDHFVAVKDGWRVDPSDRADDSLRDNVKSTLHINLSIAKPQVTSNKRDNSQPLGQVGEYSDDDDDHLLTFALAMTPRYRRRFHWRVLYDSSPLTRFAELHHMPTVVNTSMDAIKALQLLWKHDWMHRDISAGNIYFDQTNGVGRISDYEYMSQYSTSRLPSEQMKTGTAGFMAAEVAEGRYKFVPHRGAKKAFYFNPLHDLESVWWLLVWSLFQHIPEECHDPEVIMQQTEAKRRLCFDIFTRTNCLMDQTAFFDIVESTLHSDLRSLALKVDDLLVLLRQNYQSAERVIPIPKTAFDTVHKEVLGIKDELVKSAESLGSGEVDLVDGITDQHEVES